MRAPFAASVLLAASAVAQPTVPAEHDARDPMRCKRCRAAYAKALDHTLTRLRRASFPAQMVMGWVLLADGRHPQDLDYVIDEAMRWKERVGSKLAHNHRRNWYPALAGMLLAEHAKFHPDREVREALEKIVAHFVYYQERTGGWFKWHEGAYNDRPDYAVKDLGILDAIVLGILSTVRAQGIDVPSEVYTRAEACLHGILSDRGISYGTGSRGGDVTGARGAFAINGLLYARDDRHEIVRVYRGLLPRQIENMDQGHHVGAFHCLGVVLGCHLLGPDAYRELTDHWLDRLIDKQEEDGGIYVGDDGDAGGEVGLLGEDDASTAAAALLILLQDPTRLVPSEQPEIDWLAVALPPADDKELAKLVDLAAAGALGEVVARIDKLLDARKPPEQERYTALSEIRERVVTHAERRLAEAEQSIERRDVARGVELLEVIAADLAKLADGRAARDRLTEIAGDPALQTELDAQRELQKAWRAAARKGLARARKAFEAVVARYPGTAAAEKAAELLE